jgi:hypothetical protein
MNSILQLLTMSDFSDRTILKAKRHAKDAAAMTDEKEERKAYDYAALEKAAKEAIVQAQAKGDERVAKYIAQLRPAQSRS